MKIFVICSKVFYPKIPAIMSVLKQNGHQITLPNCYDKPETEDTYRGTDGHASWKSNLLKHSEKIIKDMDAVLVLNFDKKDQKNYIGGATFLEMYDAFRLDKKIFLYNDIPEGMLKDEIIGFCPIIINSDLNKIQ